ncbi:hypothetical protein CWI37_0051p0030 [Hamiltosporidium tvaerminnensis]|uniref:Uncharacterized protein n=1 Tax=Hamiltosporidium tvaerminnensis TaxID=1176355 RepID=A0A4Q9LBZ3_9MICR|nr:hypothetical protein CWI37_0051p0030 [Hamiltosporidium tvaerminnensis]
MTYIICDKDDTWIKIKQAIKQTADNEEDKSEKKKSTDYNTANENVLIENEETTIQPTLEEKKLLL